MKRVLYAEDDLDMQEMFSHYLREHGWEVITARDGREALAIYHQELNEDRPFDAILLDVGMPHLDGFAVGVNIRNVETFADDTEVPRARHIYLSAYDAPVPPAKLKESLFADEYLMKPVDPKVVLRALNGEKVKAVA